MQISNNIQSQQNFGMALKIKQGGISEKMQKVLADLPEDVLESIKTTGLNSKAVINYHVLMDEEGAKIISEKGAYFGEFRTPKLSGKLEQNGNVLMIKSEKNNDLYGISKLGLPDDYTGLPQYSVWSLAPMNTYQDVPALGRIAKLLDDAAVENYKKNLAESVKKEEANRKAGELLDTFGF
jgi:hypothetical protein